MNDCDEQRLQTMHDLLQMYDRRITTASELGNLVSELEALLNTLECVNEKWKGAFRRQWGVLEIEYSTEVDRDRIPLENESIVRILTSIREMQILIDEQLEVISELHASVRQAVYTEWDPIGFSGRINQANEYDIPIQKLCDLLRKNTPEKEIAEYLWKVERDLVGLEGNRQSTDRFAKWLCSLKPSADS